MSFLQTRRPSEASRDERATEESAMADQEQVISDPMLGREIGNYVVSAKIAEGGMGAVYLARHRTLLTRKVIKTILPQYAQHASLRERFEREAVAISKLRHKHIVRIDDYGQLPDGQLFFVMDHLDGKSLDTHLAERGRLQEHRALHILIQACVGLQFMHDAGFIHRDIKPSNIYITREDDNPYQVHLIDLGLAKSSSEQLPVTRDGAIMGTPGYMAVEQYEGTRGVTHLADIQSLAIVIWEMLTLSLPWGPHDVPMVVLHQRMKDVRPARPAGMSEAWYAVLSRALSPHQEDRPQSARDLAVELADSVEAILPFVPSGPKMIEHLASSFIRSAPPSGETVRGKGSDAPLEPLRWPVRDTPPPLRAVDLDTPVNTRVIATPDGARGGLRGPVGPQSTLTAAASQAASSPRLPAQRPRSRVRVFGASVALVAASGIGAYLIGTQVGASSVRPSSPGPSAPLPFASASSAGVAPDTVPPADAALRNDAPAIDTPAHHASPLSGPAPATAPRPRRSPAGLQQPTAYPQIQRPQPRSAPSDDGEPRGSDNRFDRNAAAGD